MRVLSPLFTAFVFLASGAAALAMNPDDYEEPAGPNAHFLFNPADELYGVSVGGGIWLRNTPVFADYFASVFDDGYEESWYSAFGMTLRLMPHWRLAPFAGAGGSYDLALSSSTEDRPDTLSDGGECYWGGHVEAGLRAWFPWRYRMLEVGCRYTWTSLSDEREYWTTFIGMGAEL
jgi:hypothetical protein